MAIDTRDKRASAIMAWRIIPITPNPDGTVGSGDRWHIAYAYRGVAALPPIPFDDAILTLQVYR